MTTPRLDRPEPPQGVDAYFLIAAPAWDPGLERRVSEDVLRRARRWVDAWGNLLRVTIIAAGRLPRILLRPTDFHVELQKGLDDGGAVDLRATMCLLEDLPEFESCSRSGRRKILIFFVDWESGRFRHQFRRLEAHGASVHEGKDLDRAEHEIERACGSIDRKLPPANYVRPGSSDTPAGPPMYELSRAQPDRPPDPGLPAPPRDSASSGDPEDAADLGTPPEAIDRPSGGALDVEERHDVLAVDLQRTAPCGPPEPHASRLLKRRAQDKVHFSVAFPPRVAAGATFVLRVFAHLKKHRREMERQAKMAAPGEILLQTQGPLLVDRGLHISFRLEIQEWAIEPAEAHVLWDEDLASSGFLVNVPSDGAARDVSGHVTIFVSGIQLTRLHFVVTVGPEALPAGPPQLTDLIEKRFKTAFASYASADREEVIGRVQGILKIAPHLDVFLDRKDLRPGQIWSEAILGTIPERDVFYLFWSRRARESEWVEREWRHALQTRGLDFIDPVPLEPPEVAPPPPELQQKHFDDWLLLLKTSLP